MAAEPVRIGMVRLTDAAPVVYAAARGLFAAAGLDVRIAVEPSWANVADKLAWGMLDAAVMLSPLAIAMTLGLRGTPTPLVVAAGVSRNGDAITLATHLSAPLLQGGRGTPAEMAAKLRPALPLRLAVVHAFSTHDLLLRLFLEAGGIDPAPLAPFAVIPPAEMVEALRQGEIDGFCAGAPWGAVAAEAGVGRTIAVSSEIVPDHPEKCFAVRQGWAAAHPEALQALVAALDGAARVCDDPARGPEIAALLAGPEWLDVPPELIAASLPGGIGGEVDRSRFGAARPSAADADWLVRQMGRWRELPPMAGRVVEAMYRSSLQPAVPGSD